MNKLTTAASSIKPYVIGLVAGALALASYQTLGWYQSNASIIRFCTENKTVVEKLDMDAVRQFEAAKTTAIFEKTYQKASEEEVKVAESIYQKAKK